MSGGFGARVKNDGAVMFHLLVLVVLSGRRLNLLEQLPAPSNGPCLDAFGHHRQAAIRVLLAFGNEVVAEDETGTADVPTRNVGLQVHGFLFYPSSAFIGRLWIRHGRHHGLLAFIQVAAVNIIDTELLDTFEEYSGYGNTSVERVRFVLMKMNADRANKTNYFIHKFMDKIKLIFGGLPKPKEWRSLLENDLPLLTSIDDDVQEPFASGKLAVG